MIGKYVFGKPYDTGACVVELPAEEGHMPYFQVETGERGLRFRLALDDSDAIYGLGETVRGINKRGFLYRSNNVDENPESEEKHSLYGSHNYMVVKGRVKCFGVFFDDPAWLEFDLAFTDPDEVVITSRYGDLNVYILEEPTVNAVNKAFRRLIGRSYLPPKWAFGYIQSRWGGISADSVNETLAEYEAMNMPVDAFCVDIDGLDGFQNFTWNRESFPDPERFVREKLQQGIHLVPIVDVAIRQEETNEDYISGREADVFCKGPEGEEFVGYVWPGRCVFPDYFQESCQKWFGHLYQKYLNMGVYGFWNDMNEPAIFATEDGFRRAREAVRQLSAASDCDFMSLGALRNNDQLLYDPEKDHRNFCHRIGGELVPDERVHNLYGGMMARGSDAGFREYDEHTRFLLFSRSSFIGSHRYTGVWLGDNSAWWSHLLQNLKWLPAMNMCGYLYTGCDIGGFLGDTCDELMLRWLQLGVFTPLMRNHSAMGTRQQELFRFRRKEQMAKMVQIRYALVPYLYSEFMKAALRDEVLYRPLAFDYPEDARACRVEDQVMLGGECMLAPIYEQNGKGRYVYLPEDMLLMRMRSVEDYEEIPLTAGDHYIDADTDQLIFFIKKNTAIPMAKPALRVKDIDYGSMAFHGWLEQDCEYALYNDDGLSKHVSLDSIQTISVACKKDNS